MFEEYLFDNPFLQCICLKFCLVYYLQPVLTSEPSIIFSEKKRRTRRKFGTYTLDGQGKRKRSSISTADDDAPSQSEGKDTVKSSTDSYAVPQEKEGKTRHKLAERTASPSSAEAARTLLDLPDETPTTSKLAANLEGNKVIGNAVPGEENGADSFGKAVVIYETPPITKVNGAEDGVVDGVPSTDAKNLGLSGVNGWADPPIARLTYGDNNKPPLPASRMVTKRENEPLKIPVVTPIAAAREARCLTEEKLLSKPVKRVDSGHLDEEMDTKNLNLVHDTVQGVTGSSKSEGGPVGSKRRKGAVPRRVPQEQDGMQTSLEDVKKEFGQGLDEYHTTADKVSGKELATAASRVIPSADKDCQSALQDSLSGKAMSTLPPPEKKEIEVLEKPVITQILKAISYSNSVTHDKQEVVVLFKASRLVLIPLLCSAMFCGLRIFCQIVVNESSF